MNWTRREEIIYWESEQGDGFCLKLEEEKWTRNQKVLNFGKLNGGVGRMFGALFYENIG